MFCISNSNYYYLNFNMRYSRQRNIIKDIVFSTNLHPNADWIYHEAKNFIPSISLGTVYRNLKQLSKMGIIKTIYDGSVARFDWNTHPHNHLKCIECGRITDVKIDKTNNLTDKISDNHSFDVHDIEVTFIGTCSEHNNNK